MTSLQIIRQRQKTSQKGKNITDFCYRYNMSQTNSNQGAVLSCARARVPDPNAQTLRHQNLVLELPVLILQLLQPLRFAQLQPQLDELRRRAQERQAQMDERMAAQFEEQAKQARERAQRARDQLKQTPPSPQPAPAPKN